MSSKVNINGQFSISSSWRRGKSCKLRPSTPPVSRTGVLISPRRRTCSSSSASAPKFKNPNVFDPQPPQLTQDIKSQLLARDRDNELEDLLKRKSLQQLSRQNSVHHTCNYGSAVLSQVSVIDNTKRDTNMNLHAGLARINSPRSIGSTESSTAEKSSILVRNLARALRSNCDRILNRSIPFTIDSELLYHSTEAINEVTSKSPSDENPADSDYTILILFLADFYKQTPSLSITTKSDTATEPFSLDLTLFRALESLDLRKVTPSTLSGLNTLHVKLKNLRINRGIVNLNEIFSEPSTTSVGLTSVWPELLDLDCSYNRLTQIDSRLFEVTPVLETLNLSRNCIVSIDSCFSRVLNCLTVLNLNYNQLTRIPPLPANVKVLLISNNYISTIESSNLFMGQLEVLDVSQNMISDDRGLDTLRQLCSLKSLAFTGNPITYTENYRGLISSNLNRLAVCTKFILDGIKLSKSEVKAALEFIKRQRPALILTSSNPLCFVSKCNPLTNLQSLTKSYDSNSTSSLRSACRKKARIREVVILDSDSSINTEPETISKSKLKNDDSSSTSSSGETLSSTIKEAVVSLIERHGQDNWLLRQSGKELTKLCNIQQPIYPTAAADYKSLSRSLPSRGNDNTSYYSAVAEWDNSESGDVEVLSSTVESSSSTLAVDREDNSDSDSVRCITDGSHDSSSDILFYSCLDESAAGIENTVDFPNARFKDETGLSTTYRTFLNGQVFKLIIHERYLYEVDPSQNDLILTKWDLKSLKDIVEIKTDKETETVQVQLSFDTIRKQWRERSFIMSTKDLAKFESETAEFLSRRTLQEFDCYQCIRCGSQFSRAMALTSVVQIDKVPTEVSICPHCESELLVVLESIPLPNNESISIGGEKFSKGLKAMSPGIIMTSTPITDTGTTKGSSLPGAGFFRAAAGRYRQNRDKNADRGHRNGNSQPHSNLTSTQSSPTNNNFIHEANPDGVSTKHTHSESDIETLSCDSSSIEVLNRTGNEDSCSDDIVAVEEGIEILISDNCAQLTSVNTANIPTMTESNSSGGSIGAGSTCTQYEKTITAGGANVSGPGNVTSKHVSSSSRLPIPFPRTISSTVLAPLSTSPSSKSKIPGFIPIKYDYSDYSVVDHRIQLFIELSVFKHEEERLLALVKVTVLVSNGIPIPSLVIFSDRKLYIYKITGAENDQPDTWLSKHSSFPINKLSKLDVLIGRHGIGLDLSSASKYYALLFRSSQRTSDFIEFFLSEVCSKIESLCLVQDFSQTHKALMSPVNPITYFGILPMARITEGSGRTYPLSAIVLTNEELILVTDLSWLVSRGCENSATTTISAKYERSLDLLRQMESLECDATYLRLLFQLDNSDVHWDLQFETGDEKQLLLEYLKSSCPSVPFISLSQPIEA